MTFFKNKKLKAIAVLSTVVFFMSCTNEVSDSASGLIDNEGFVRDTITSKVSLTTIDVDSIRTDLLANKLIGSYTNPQFGTVNASIVSQLSSSSYPIKKTSKDALGEVTVSNVNVVLQLPLNLDLIEGSTTQYVLRDALGDSQSGYTIKTSTFETFLENFNIDGIKRAYYSNQTNNARAKESLGQLTDLEETKGYQFKSIYAKNLDSLIQFPLGKYDFQKNFFDKEAFKDNSIETGEELRTLFKGIKLELIKESGNGLLTSLDLSKAKLIIDYTATYKVTDVVSKTSKDTISNEELSLNLGGVSYSLLTHDHQKPNNNNKAYVQGAGGYVASFDVSDIVSENESNLSDENLFINQATLKVFVDKDLYDENISQSTFTLYGVSSENEIALISDYAIYGEIGGVVNNTDPENPYIVFFITNAIKEAFKDGNIKQFRIQAENSINNLLAASAKGIVLENDIDSKTKAPELQIIYSKIE